MTKVSLVDHCGGRTVLYEVRNEPPLEFKLPNPEYTDTLYEDIFCNAQEQLGLSSLKPVYKDNHKILVAPDGFMFRATKAFTVFPDGNNIEWGYGNPTSSYEEFRRQNKQSLVDLENQGLSTEAAEQEVFDTDEWDQIADLNLHQFLGKSLALSINHISWGQSITTEQANKLRCASEQPSVNIRVRGFQQTWFEQARRFVKLPDSTGDRLLTTYEYGMPGVVPCWMGKNCEGDIEHMTIELVPVEEGVGDKELPTMHKLWLPESVRYSLLKDYPNLIDQGGDNSTRSGFGNAMRILGGLAAGSQNQNAVDKIAEETSKKHLVVIDDPMLAHMDIAELAIQVEDIITTSNESDPRCDPRALEQAESDRKYFEMQKKQLVVITGVNESIEGIAERIGKSDDWLKRHIGHQATF